MMNNNMNVLYFDKKGKPCSQKDAVLCVIQDLDKDGKVIRETEVSITDDEG